MDGKYTNNPAPKFLRSTNGPRPMQQLIRRTARFNGLPDLYSFYCVVCDEWHVEEGDAVVNQRPHRRAGLGQLLVLAPQDVASCTPVLFMFYSLA